MKAVLLVLTNGRAICLERSLASLEENLDPLPATRLIFDDSGDPVYSEWLGVRFPTYSVSANGPLGYSGAMRRALDHVAALPVDWVWITEDDFLYRRPVPVMAMAKVLTQHPQLAQMVLRRQAWFPSERRAGGLIERFPAGRFTERAGYLEHRVFWSMNPHLVRRETLARFPWPLGPASERRFGERLFRAGLTVGLWGARDEEPWVEHIGQVRVGAGY